MGFRVFFFFAIVFPSVFSFTNSQAAVWTNRYQWDANWESRYQQWVNEAWDADFYLRRGPYKNLRVDCADAVYTMRYAFAAENGLPFVIKDPTGGKDASGAPMVISNSITRWDNQSDEDKKRSFLNYLFGVISTRSLPADSYPVAVNRKAITSGTFLLTDAASHHSWTVKYISDTGIPFLIFSSRPAKSQLFTRFEYPTTAFTFPHGLTEQSHAGFRAFRQPQDIGKAVWEVPGYSQQQYQIRLNVWAQTLQSALSIRDEAAEEVIERQLFAICQGAQDRIIYVNDALNYIGKVQRCLNAVEYDDLSSPSRDRRLLGSIEDLQKTYNELSQQGYLDKISAPVKAKFLQVLFGSAGNYCALQISANKTMSLFELVDGFDKGWVSSNPHDSLEARWGMTNQKSELAKKCATY